MMQLRRKTYEKTYDDINNRIINYCNKERTAKEIANFCNYKCIDRFKRNYLKLLTVLKKVKMTLLD